MAISNEARGHAGTCDQSRFARFRSAGRCGTAEHRPHHHGRPALGHDRLHAHSAERAGGPRRHLRERLCNQSALLPEQDERLDRSSNKRHTPPTSSPRKPFLSYRLHRVRSFSISRRSRHTSPRSLQSGTRMPFPIFPPGVRQATTSGTSPTSPRGSGRDRDSTRPGAQRSTPFESISFGPSSPSTRQWPRSSSPSRRAATSQTRSSCT